MAAALERFRDDRLAAAQRFGIQPALSVHRVVDAVDARSRQHQQPAQIGRGDEVPGGSQDVGADDLAGVEGPQDVVLDGFRHAEPEGP